MERVFIDNDGMWYKANVAAHPNHAERPCVTQEFLEALTDRPQHLIDVERKIQVNLAKRMSPAPAPIPEKAKDGNVAGE